MGTLLWLRGLCDQLFLSRQRASFRGARQPAAAEMLEARRLLAASMTLIGSEVVITGTAEADVATVESVDSGNVRVRVTTGAETVEQVFTPAVVNVITFNAAGGNDRLTNTTDKPISMLGGDGADTLIGGIGNDTFLGGAGNDSLNGGGGNEVAFGGDGKDTLLGGSGMDLLLGEAGNDKVNGGGFTGDTVSGGLGDDTLDGGVGTDAVTEINLAKYTLTNASSTGLGNDTILGIEQAILYGDGNANRIDVTGFPFFASLFGGGGDDTLLASDSGAKLYGGAGKDLLLGRGGHDQLFGQGGSGDTLRGGLGNDMLDGGAGDDLLDGGEGTDRLTGSTDVSFTLSDSLLRDGGRDAIAGIESAWFLGGPSPNRMDASGFSGPVTLRGESGNDTLLGGAANDVLGSGEGDDSLDGGSGNDQLSGDRGNDSLNGGAGNDSLSGWEGDDLLDGGDGDDTLSGDSAAEASTTYVGNDTVIGGRGADSLKGGHGSDSLIGGEGDDRLIGDVKWGYVYLDAIFDDTLDGGNGNDLLQAGLGHSLMLAGAGNDDAGSDGTATIFGGAGSDKLGGGRGNIVLYGEAGDDFLFGGGGDDSLDGGDGNDVLVGRDGRDSLYGGAGNDSLRKGGSGWDPSTLVGNDGNDTLMGADKNDLLDGGAGGDILVGNFGDDTLLGGADRDVVIAGHGRDLVDGGSGDDLVTGAYYKHQSDAVLMNQLWTDWNNASSYRNRVVHLEDAQFSGQWQSMTLATDKASLRDDYVLDTVYGGDGQDYFGRPGDSQTFAPDETPDWDALTERMNVSVPDAEAPGFSPNAVPLPGYLETLNDPTFETPITRITNDPGTPLELPVNTSSLGFDYIMSTVWSSAVRTRYVVDSSWNIDGSLLMLRSYDPATGYRLVLDGETYEPKYFAMFRSTNYRWSQNPAKPTIQYDFPQSAALDNLESMETQAGTTLALPTFTPDDHRILAYDVGTNLITKYIDLPFEKLFSTKTSIAFRNGHEYVAMCGVDKWNPGSGISVYVVDLDSPNLSNPIVFSFPLTGPDSGTPESTFSGAIDFQNLWFSPDGQHILVCYNGSSVATRSWRLLDVNYDTRTIAPHVIPKLTADDSFQTNGDRTKGHFPVNWSHPTFALGPNGTDVYVVGVSGQFNQRAFPQNEVTTQSGVVGSVLAFNVTTNTFKSLSDPTNENQATHITATNTQHPGYIFVSYWNDLTNGRGPKYAGEIVAINLADPFGANGTIELAHHRTNIANDFYHGNTLPTVSPDGKKLIFSSTWGPQQGFVQTFVLDLSAKLT
jgi:Ca2+-binding RTX toxin-like protein